MAVKRRQVDMFLLGLYQGAAGMLPNKLLGTIKNHTFQKCLINSEMTVAVLRNFRFQRAARSRDCPEKLSALLGSSDPGNSC